MKAGRKGLGGVGGEVKMEWKGGWREGVKEERKKKNIGQDRRKEGRVRKKCGTMYWVEGRAKVSKKGKEKMGRRGRKRGKVETDGREGRRKLKQKGKKKVRQNAKKIM